MNQPFEPERFTCPKEGVMFGLVLVIGLAFAGWRWGVDSRPHEAAPLSSR